MSSSIETYKLNAVKKTDLAHRGPRKLVNRRPASRPARVGYEPLIVQYRLFN